MNSQHRRQESKVKFLDDSPVSNDELKLHKNIANTIKKIIDLTKESNKKIIGLFGPWGSGKSTVVEILKNDLGKDKVFIFNSWSHRGDFLKRAFLLEMAKSFNITKEKYVNKENNNKELTIEKILTRKLIDKSIKPTINLEFPTALLSIIILLAIIITAISKIIDFLIIPYIPISWIDSLSNIIDNKIIIVGIVGLILSYFALKPFVEFYFLKQVDITESHLTKENLEFTNYDYGKYLNYILKKAKEKNKLSKSNPFIIVFDNLDRVDDETVLNTLSMIQLTNEVIEKSSFNIYFLIPIDKERLEKTIKTIIAGDSNNKEEKEKFAKDFLEKIFPYKVNIPNIIHSDWRKFFSKKIQEAFDFSLKKDDIYFIRRIFENSIIKSKEKNLTPREIKSFINSLVENYLYWENFKYKPNIKLQSLYVTLNNYFSKDFKEYIAGNLDSNNNKELNNIVGIAKEEYLEKEIKESLLKQYFKVEEIYVLFIEQSIQAIDDEKLENLKNIVNLFEDKYKIEQLFYEVWKQKDELRKDINLLLKFYKAVKEIDIYDKEIDIYNKYRCKISQFLKEIINNVNTFSKLKEPNIDKLIDILNNNDEIKTLFLEKSIEIITEVSEEKESNGT